jgi:hypothetical protein
VFVGVTDIDPFPCASVILEDNVGVKVGGLVGGANDDMFPCTNLKKIKNRNINRRIAKIANTRLLFI